MLLPRKIKSNLITKYCGITHESLLNQFILGNSYLSRRTYWDNSVEIVKLRVALDMFKTFTTTPAQTTCRTVVGWGSPIMKVAYIYICADVNETTSLLGGLRQESLAGPRLCLAMFK